MTPLPPLNSLRAFDAAARHGTISLAAEALHVTHGAVSKQIASLEAFLGVTVFERTAHGLVQTEAGAVLAPIVAEALDAMAEGVRRVRRDCRPNREENAGERSRRDDSRRRERRGRRGGQRAPRAAWVPVPK